MIKDYAYRTTKHSSNIFIKGCGAIILIIIAILYFSFNYKNKSIIPLEARVDEVSIVEEDNFPRFEFYSVLPKLNMDEIDVKESSASYFIDISSFRKNEDARFLIKSLELLNLNPKVGETIIGEDTWYKVSLGPYNDFNQAQAYLNILNEHNYKSILIKKVS